MTASCNDFSLEAFQSLCSASIGVALAYPILSALMKAYEQRVLQDIIRYCSSERILRDRIEFYRLGRIRNNFSIESDGLSRLNNYVIVINIIIGLLAFIAILVSTLSDGICLSSLHATGLSFLASLPFALGVVHGLRWYDVIAPYSSWVDFYERYF